MITSLTVATPSATISRAGFDPEQLKNFERVTGIKNTRHWNGSTTDLALEAVIAAEADIPKSQIGLIVVVTQSPDRFSPCMAVEIAKTLGLPLEIPMFDVNQSCTGFLYGLRIALKMSPPGMSALLVCVDMLRMHDGELDSLIFSDAACCAVIKETERGALLPSLFVNDPKGSCKLYSSIDGVMHMDGGAVFDFVVSNVPKLIHKYEDLYGKHEFLAQHQPNLSMMGLVDKRSGFEKKSLYSIQEYGNMSMSSIPMAIALNERQILGKNLIMCGYGAGFSAAVAGTRWSTKPICRIVEV